MVVEVRIVDAPYPPVRPAEVHGHRGRPRLKLGGEPGVLPFRLETDFDKRIAVRGNLRAERFYLVESGQVVLHGFHHFVELYYAVAFRHAGGDVQHVPSGLAVEVRPLSRLVEKRERGAEDSVDLVPVVGVGPPMHDGVVAFLENVPLFRGLVLRHLFRKHAQRDAECRHHRHGVHPFVPAAPVNVAPVAPVPPHDAPEPAR